MSRRSHRVALAVAIASLGACAPQPRVRVADLPVAGVEETAAPDARALFREAKALYDRGRFGDAALRLDDAAALSPAEPLLRAILFHAGLAFEGLRRYETALARYVRVLALHPEPKLALDTRFRIARCEEARKAWPAAETAWGAVVTMELTLPDRAEATFRRGLARQHQERFDDAEQDYRATLALYEASPDHPRLRSLAVVSRAQFQIGEIYRHRFSRIAFRLPLASMERAWEQKATLFLKAQHAYLAAVWLPNEHWAIAAGHQLGFLFERMYFDMLAAEVPDDLDPEDRAVYQDELRRLILPYVERAVEIYETNLAIAERHGHDGDWVSRTRERLTTLRREVYGRSK